jgi:hypothetical protein
MTRRRMGERGIPPLILKLGTRLGGSSVSSRSCFTSRAKSPFTHWLWVCVDHTELVRVMKKRNSLVPSKNESTINAQPSFQTARVADAFAAVHLRSPFFRDVISRRWLIFARHSETDYWPFFMGISSLSDEITRSRKLGHQSPTHAALDPTRTDTISVLNTKYHICVASSCNRTITIWTNVVYKNLVTTY